MGVVMELDYKKIDLNSLKLDSGIEGKPNVLPDPKGYKMLIILPEFEEKTAGGILLPGQALEREQTASIVGFVYKMGDLCYKDEDKFPTGPWCKEGDFVVFRAYSGTRLKVHGREFRLINDDTVEAVVDDPRGIYRA
jgi:co-chaperonin GroES (HSP10)